MNLKNFSNKELHEKLKMFLDQENKLNQDILIHLVEVDRRKLYLEMAYPSLFEYLTSGIGFSAASAQRRIDAARLMRQIPEVAEQLRDGSVNLVQIGKIQAASRLLKKRGSVVTVENKKTLLAEIQNKTVKETELIIAKRFDLPILTLEKSVLQKDESIRMEITFTKEEMEKIESAKALLSHSINDGSLKDLVLYLAERVIVQKTKLMNQKPQSKDQKNKVRDQKAHSGNGRIQAEVQMAESRDQNIPARIEKVQSGNQKIPTRIEKIQNINQKTQVRDCKPQATIQSPMAVFEKPKSIPINLRKTVFLRDQCCQYQDSSSGRKCGSKYFLEIDHVQPRWSGGKNQIENLRLLCSSHNKYRYQMGR